MLDSKRFAATIGPLVFKCDECVSSKCLATEQALLQHKRIAHKWRDPILKFIDGSGTCPICRTCFVTRLRVLAHVTGKRRDKCRRLILDGDLPTLTDEQLANLEGADREARNEARKLGRTHAIACNSARLVNGKRVGRVQN